MSEVSRIGTVGPDQLPADVERLMAAVDGLPDQQRQAIAPVVCGVMEATRRRRRILALVQEALSQLRLDMKYLLFDLEATRRERDQYRGQLEEDTL